MIARKRERERSIGETVGHGETPIGTRTTLRWIYKDATFI